MKIVEKKRKVYTFIDVEEISFSDAELNVIADAQVMLDVLASKYEHMQRNNPNKVITIDDEGLDALYRMNEAVETLKKLGVLKVD